MSFWSENKNTIKSAGIATAKGIGNGTKALSKAGYNTYKKSDASRKGLPPPGERKNTPPPMGPSAPLMEKEKLLSLPPPPRRTVPIHEAPTIGNAATNLNILGQSTATAPQHSGPPPLPEQRIQPPVPLPERAQQPLQRTSTFSRPPMPTPVPEPSLEPVTTPVPVPPRDPAQRAPIVVPASQPVSQAPAQLPVQTPVQPPVQPATQPQPPAVPAQRSVQTQQSSQQSTDYPAPRVPKPAPDASMFTPPPVHKNRGNFDSQKHSRGSSAGAPPRPVSAGAPAPSLPSRTGSNSGTAHGEPATNLARGHPDFNSPPPSYTESPSESVATPSTTGSARSGSETQPARASVRYVDIDVSKFGPPPPRRVDAPARVVSRSDSVTSSRSSVPPPPPKPLSATNTASISLRLSAAEVPAKPNAVEIPAKPKALEIPAKPKNLEVPAKPKALEVPLEPKALEVPVKPDFVESPAEIKKVPPPKPAKLQKSDSGNLSQNSTSNNSFPEAIPSKSQSTFPTTPNFAAEIARLKLQKAQGSRTEENMSPQLPPKPVKREISQNSPDSEFVQQPAQSRAGPPSKPPKPQMPPKPTKPTGISSLNGVPSSSKENVTNDPDSSTNPLVPPVSQRRILTPEQRIPGFRVPVKGQFHHKHIEALEAPKENSNHKDSAGGGVKPPPKPLVIPLTGKPDFAVPPKPHLPGFKIPVKGTTPHPDTFNEQESSLLGVNETTGGYNSEIPSISKSPSRDQISSKSARSTPPPAPPSRNSKNVLNVSSGTSTPPPPPPARNYIRPAAQKPPKPIAHPDLDLELSTRWYATTASLQLPKSLAGLNYSTSYQSSTKAFPGGTITENNRSIEVRFKDLSKAVYNIKWMDNRFSDAVLEVVHFLPSPIENKCPTKKELWEYSERFGKYITSWCLHREGQKVGTGECWDLAKEALAKGCGKHAFVSQYYHHGYPFLELAGGESGASVSKGPEDEIRPGDILQFKLAKLYSKSTGVTQTVGSPDHTAVVYEKDNDVIRVLEQNVQGVKLVRKGEYVLSNMVSGSVAVYRPVPAEWAE